MSQPLKKSSLGKGIRALLDTIDEEIKAPAEGVPAATGQHSNNVTRIPIAQIEINPKQPRRDFDEKALGELSESIKLHDIIQPITVSQIGPDLYRLISGERRLRASKMAGLTDIPAYVRAVENSEMLELALIENLQREDLNAMEIAMSYRQLMDECELTQEQVAERMKKDRSTIANFLRLLKLPPDIQSAIREGKLSMGHARAISGLNFVEQQLYLFRETLERGLSVRQVEQLAKELAIDKPVAETPSIPAKLPLAYKKIEDSIASLFSTKVTMQRKKSGKGTIAIEFYNDEDLERIIEKMNL
jgi:ParB family transcriptional regulator, chromosome partitioning protein